jgi:hypothetical protein
MFEKMVLRILFGQKRSEGTGGWRKIHKEELYNCTLSLVSVDEVMVYGMGREYSTKEEKRDSY